MKKIVAVLNDFKKADDLLQKAITLTKEHNAILEVLYIHEESLFDIPDYFLSDESIKESFIDKNKIRKEIKDEILKLGFEKDCAILVFIDDTVDRVFTQTREDTSTDTMIITPYHQDITQKLLKKSNLPILVVKNSIKDYKNIVLPVDLGENTKICIDLANNVLPNSKKHLVYDYRYIVDTSILDIDYLGIPTEDPIINNQINQELEKSQLESFEALKKETGFEGSFIAESLSIEEDLLNFIELNHFDLTVLCSNSKHFLSLGSVSLSLLEKLETDILITTK